MARDIAGEAAQSIPDPETIPSGPQLPPGLTVAAVHAQLERILASEYFAHSERLSRFLRFAVEQVLLGQENKLKEYLIGVEVFDRHEAFDPRIDSIVRVEARRLRSKLDQYYEGEGREDGIQIQLRKGRYAPSFRNRQQQPGKLQPGTLPIPAERSWRAMAVLPFESLSQEPSHQLFADGLTQEVIASLTRLPGLRIAARTSSFQYRERFADIRRIGEELRVDALLTGSIRREGDRARVTVHLIHVAEGYYLWSDSFDRDARDVFAAQEEIARKILAAVGANLAARPDMRPAGVAAVDLNQPQAEQVGPDGGRPEGRGPADAPPATEAIAGLCFTLSLETLLGVVNPEDARRTAAGYAQQLRPLGWPDSWAALALAQTHAVDWNWEAAEESFARSIQQQPDDAATRGAYGIFLTLRGQLNEGLEELRLAEELAPASALLMAAVGWILYLKRDTARAVERFRDALAADGELAFALAGLADADLLRLSYAEAVEMAGKAAGLTGGAGFARTGLARALVLSGRRVEGEHLLGEILVDARRRYVSPARIAAVYAALGQPEQAMERLEAALALRCPELLWLPSDPAFDPIRVDSRFGRLMEKLASNSGGARPETGTA